MALGDRIGIMSEGRLLQVGTPKEIYERPACLFSASFLGSPQINLIPGELLPQQKALRWPIGREPVSLAGECPAPPGVGSCEVLVGLRPEDVLVSPRSGKPSDVAGMVEFVQDMGFEVHVLVSCGQTRLRARCPHLPSGIREGATVYVKIRTDRMFLFHRTTGERIHLRAGFDAAVPHEQASGDSVKQGSGATPERRAT